MQKTTPIATDTSLRLADGRTLAYATYGDPAGTPVLLMHGFPDSRLTRHPDDARTASLGVRLIIPDRPGVGGSDWAPARSVFERTKDLVALVDALSVERFAVLGWSMGGPYALALASRLPDRVTAVGVACGFTPMDRPGAAVGMSADMRRAIPLMRRMPWLLRPMMASVAKQYAKDPAKAFRQQFGSGISAADAAVLEQPAIRSNLLTGATEAMRPGGRGAALELQLVFGRPWGFRLEAIQLPVWLWYGDADQLVPLQMPEYLARTIPVTHLTTYPDEGHMLFYTHWEDLLTTLVAQRCV